MLYESAHVTLSAEYRIATLTVTGDGAQSLLCRAILDELDVALAIAQRHFGLDVVLLRGSRSGAFGVGPDLSELAVRLGRGRSHRRLGSARGITAGGAGRHYRRGDLRTVLGRSIGTRVGLRRASSRRRRDDAARISASAMGSSPLLGRHNSIAAAHRPAPGSGPVSEWAKAQRRSARDAGLIHYAFPPTTARAECDRLVLDLQAAAISLANGNRGWIHCPVAAIGFCSKPGTKCKKRPARITKRRESCYGSCWPA